MSERERDKEKIRVQHTGVQYEYDFNNSKIEPGERPPVLGEERAQCRSEWGPQPLRPAPRIPNHPHHLYTHPDGHPTVVDPRLSAPCRPLPPEPGMSVSPPACLRWARALPHLLQDPDGVQLFKRYLQLEGPPHADHLDFWFACEGLRKHAVPDKVLQLVKVIYKRFFVKSVLPVSEDLRREVAKQVKEFQPEQPNINLFDAAQREIERLINNTTYPNFLNSEMYLQYVQSVNAGSSGSDLTSSGSSSSSSSISAREMALLNQASGLLPTLHEDSELVTTQPHSHGGSQIQSHSSMEPIRLTKDMLLVTQKRRLDVKPKPEAYIGMIGRTPYHHAAYNSYVPVSRQDSELQSLSSHSDARTESDNMSLTDSSLDGMSVYRSSRKQSARASRAARELASVNREPLIGQTLIPRTQRLDSKQCQPLPPDRFAAILIEKLEAVKRQQEAQEAFDRKLMENDCGMIDQKQHINDTQSRMLADAIREKFHLDDDNDQDILDQHVSRVWSDLTPSRSPGLLSPRAHSPTRRRDLRRRKERDVFSTFSSDSGNVHDFPDPETCSGGLPKSRSVPDYHDREYLQDGRFVRQSVSRRSSSKKTLTDLTDSGVSVVSDTPPVALPTPAGAVKESRVLTWLMESDRRAAPGGCSSHTHSELSAGRHRSTRQPTSPNASRHRKPSGQSRSSSLERSVAMCGGGERRGREPAQPFVADPNMPPLPPPHTATQLEEARRRLDEEMRRQSTRQRSSCKSGYLMDSLSNQSTMRRSLRGTKSSGPQTLAPAPQPPPTDDYTIVVFSFCEEQFPYRTRIPGKHITLKQFKDYLPKKGNYRYFFKTECEELDNQVIQEEISCDTDHLPLFEGKVMAQVKPTE